jgi:hypothetical protein
MPWRRCRHKNPTDPLKPSDGCCQTCASWTDTSAALLRSETERFAGLMVEEIQMTQSVAVHLQNEANFYKSVQWLAKLDYGGGIKCEGARLFSHGGARFPTAMTQRWLVVVQVSRPRTRVARVQVSRRVLPVQTSRRRTVRIQASRRRRSVMGVQISRRRTSVMGVQNSKRTSAMEVQISRRRPSVTGLQISRCRMGGSRADDDRAQLS